MHEKALAQYLCVGIAIAVLIAGCDTVPEQERHPDRERASVIYVRDVAGECWRLYLHGRINYADHIKSEVCEARAKAGR